ncbi:MAG: 6-carboxytetrahydropterin synthase [Thiogranum sp.]|nr:6-carboxytetrahydropterin synthase [Thiogranum sp.]
MNHLTSSFAVSVDPGDLRFNAAHFITSNNSCENLHGHNFHVRINACGQNDRDALVVDFVMMNRIAETICMQLHDKVLLPADSDEVVIEERDDCYHVHSYAKHYMFPAENCCLLPVSNATAEMLAWHICNQLLEALRRENAANNLSEIEVAVEEADRQWGIFRQQVAHDV